MTTLTEIFQSDADYVRRSGFKILVSPIVPSVTMTGPDGTRIYLQGVEAEAFIARAKTLWGEMKNIAIDDAYLAASKPYIEAA